MKKELVIIGAGGHAKVVLDTVISQGLYTLKGFCVDGMAVGARVMDTFRVIDDAKLSNSKENKEIYFVVAIGDNAVRKSLYENALKKYTAAVVIHGSASCGSNVMIGDGSVVFANAVVNADSKIGHNCIISTGAIVDHDCAVGDHAHLSIGTVVGSKSVISSLYTSSLAEKIESGSKR